MCFAVFRCAHVCIIGCFFSEVRKSEQCLNLLFCNRNINPCFNSYQGYYIGATFYALRGQPTIAELKQNLITLQYTQLEGMRTSFRLMYFGFVCFVDFFFLFVVYFAGFWQESRHNRIVYIYANPSGTIYI